MPTIKTEKHLGPVLGAALILGATIPAAMADCSKTENGDVADKTKVVFSNESHSTPFTVRFYKHYAGTNDYGDPIETTTVAMGEKANHQFDVSNYKNGSDKVDENTVYVKITQKRQILQKRRGSLRYFHHVELEWKLLRR